MNIFDLAWCKFYLHDERYDIGYPLFGASISMVFFIGLFINGLIMFPSVIDLYKLPNLPFLPFGIELCVIIALFIFRNRNKDTRNRKLAEYQKYKKEYPRKSNILFIMFMIIAILPFCTSIIIAID